jgi:succinyl-diaminopimelate desuccinylase
MTANPARLLCELIALPSVNPALLPGGDPRAGERRVAEFLAATAAKAGLDVELQEVFPGRSNLVAVLGATGKPRRRVLLAPHVDTVGVASDAQFTPVTRFGRIYGRGACDTKGSVASMLSALLELASGATRPAATEIVFCALIDEEVGQAGSRFLIRRGFKADLAIVGEPTRCRVVTAHKGDLWLKLETRGKAAHGARPDLGRNAVHEMAKIVDLLETTYAATLRRRRHPVLRPPTINVGAITGGQQPNIVPDRCTIDIDRRTLPGENDAAVKREILRFIRRRGLNATMADTKGEAVAPPMQTDSRLPLVRQFLRAAGQSRPLGVDYFTDAGVLAAGGIPSVVFGPGDIAQAHTVDEWVAISQLERATQLLLRFLQSQE